MKTESKNLLKTVLKTFLLTSLVMALLLVFWLGIAPRFPINTEYDAFSNRLCRTLSKEGIDINESCEFVGGWRKNYLAFHEDELNLVFRVPESMELTTLFDDTDLKNIVPYEYEPPLREREYGDFVYVYESRKADGSCEAYFSESHDGYVYVRVCITT